LALPKTLSRTRRKGVKAKKRQKQRQAAVGVLVKKSTPKSTL
jgi:hypothetical protein